MKAICQVYARLNSSTARQLDTSTARQLDSSTARPELDTEVTDLSTPRHRSTDGVSLEPSTSLDRLDRNSTGKASTAPRQQPRQRLDSEPRQLDSSTVPVGSTLNVSGRRASLDHQHHRVRMSYTLHGRRWARPSRSVLGRSGSGPSRQSGLRLLSAGGSRAESCLRPGRGRLILEQRTYSFSTNTHSLQPAAAAPTR